MTQPDPRQHGQWPPQGPQPGPVQPPQGPPPPGYQGGHQGAVPPGAQPSPGAHPGGPPPGPYQTPPPGSPPPGSPPPGGAPPPGYDGPHPPQPPRRGNGLAVGLIVGAVALVLVLMAGAGFVALRLMPAGDSGGGGGTASSGGGLDGVLYYEDLPADHVEVGETVEYEMFPPAGGPHYPAWQDCGVYEEPLRTEHVVHSQEHGAVWITYDPGLPDERVQALHALYAPGDYLVISPMEGLPSPVVASAWGSQILLEGAEDPRLPEYLITFVQADSAPEPGAPCSGGWSGTEADFAAESATDARTATD
ncbi:MULTISPECIES: DUF3105 domain-containing protein [unclassified Nocardiopsis]|uniref:DUF3105 domain-containing protein n=1 Tax=unclassified Nocardiopsis TaxID=2649073 RepID=UPI001F32F3E8|nr:MULTISPECIES: DUF3105 domain-containing protein [unclassified Nocardiopsis]